MGDAGMSAFSVFFMQSPSFLDFQVRMQKARGRNNASSLFGIEQIPSMQQIRNLLDPVSPDYVAPVFMDLVEPIVADGGLASHRALDGRLLQSFQGVDTCTTATAWFCGVCLPTSWQAAADACEPLRLRD
jgi:hypothetical protein